MVTYPNYLARPDHRCAFAVIIGFQTVISTHLTQSAEKARPLTTKYTKGTKESLKTSGHFAEN